MRRCLRVPHIEEPRTRLKVVRYFTVVFLLLYCFLGLVTIILTGWLAVKRIYSCHFMSEYFSSVYLLMAGSMFLIITSSHILLDLYLRNRQRNNSLFLIIFSVALFLEIVAPIIATVHTYVVSKETFRSDMIETFRYYRGNDDRIECIDSIQRYYRCCGAVNFTDLLPQNFTDLAGTFGLMPKSCACNEENEGQGCMTSDQDSTGRVFKATCYEKVLSDIEQSLVVVRIISPMLALVQTFLLIVVSYIIYKLQRASVIGVYVVHGKTQLERYKENVATVTQSHNVCVNTAGQNQSANSRTDNPVFPTGTTRSHTERVNEQEHGTYQTF